ncbi:hypothetical protein ALNOE001_14960 [Candidatus Methanobinarius endosymbioticus]|uniref:Methyltransferase type 11 domain-containing protein n=1 Tax=Candidatus Methanobinarius endosymbioticus TaxID=2006182 RepID=A0A366MAE3_9EURY|nr:hypothetical protein ALNOE001_14960 [Candidatus Methanobinarius endosymbioticus]
MYTLERHGFLYFYLKKINLFENEIKLLHFAPETVFYEIFSNSDNLDYWPVDMNPNSFDLDDKFKIREIVDMQEIPYKDDTFDIICNNHVLEHAPDDEKAMRELYRVVKNKDN